MQQHTIKCVTANVLYSRECDRGGKPQGRLGPNAGNASSVRKGLWSESFISLLGGRGAVRNDGTDSNDMIYTCTIARIL